MTQQDSESYRFGPFLLEANQRKLCRGDAVVPLTDKAFDLLLTLVRGAGRTVTKPELMAALWPDAVVEDSNLTQTVFVVRKALGEDTDETVYIRTVRRQGYRFVLPVTATEMERNGAPHLKEAAAAIPWMKYTWMKYTAGLALLMVLAVGAVLFASWKRTKPLTDKDVLVLADFTNTTGDSAFDGVLRQALAFELEQSPFLKIMDDEEVNQTLQLMGRPAGQRVTNDIAHEVCIREGQKATMGGSIASLGKTYQIALQATNCQTGPVLAREQALAEDKEHVLKAVAKATTGIRAKLGESLSSIQKPDRPTAFEMTTTSLEALKAYQLGYDLIAQGSSREAIAQLQRATELDPNFASAYEFLHIAYRNSGQPDRANDALKKAFSLADRVSDRERLYISGSYYHYVTGEMNKAIAAYQVDARTYPRFGGPHVNLYLAYTTTGEYEKALEEARESLRLTPRNVQAIANLMRAYRFLDRFDEAKAVAQKAVSRKLDGPPVHRELLVIADLQQDHLAYEKEIQWLDGKPDEHLRFAFEAFIATVHGQRRAYKDLLQRAVEMARHHGLPGTQLGYPPGVIDALMGDCKAAPKERSNLALVLCGDASALRVAEAQAAKHPPPNPDTAELLYQRGLAGLRAGKGEGAAVEFRKILDHRGWNWGPFYSPAYLGLGRALALAGDTAKAKRAYEDFLALLKDADPDIPILIQARKEYAALLAGHKVP